MMNRIVQVMLTVVLVGMSFFVFAENRDQPLVQVGDNAISSYDFQQYRQLIRLQNPTQNITNWNTPEVKHRVLEEMVAMYLQLHAADQEGVVLKDNQIAQSMSMLAESMGKKPKELKKYCEDNQLEYAYLRKFISMVLRINLLHQKLFYAHLDVTQEDVTRKRAAMGNPEMKWWVTAVSMNTEQFSRQDAEELAKKWPHDYGIGIEVVQWDDQPMRRFPQYMRPWLKNLKKDQTSSVFKKQDKYFFLHVNDQEQQEKLSRNLVRRQMIQEQFVQWFKPWYEHLLSTIHVQWNHHAS